jgi:tellurite resistance protein TehA-like permease
MPSLSVEKFETQKVFLCFRRYDEDDKATWQCGSWCEYIFVVVVASILLLASIVLTVFWIIYYKSGYSLEDKSKLWNFHPTLMIAGYITLSGFCECRPRHLNLLTNRTSN